MIVVNLHGYYSTILKNVIIQATLGLVIDLLRHLAFRLSGLIEILNASFWEVFFEFHLLRISSLMCEPKFKKKCKKLACVGQSTFRFKLGNKIRVRYLVMRAAHFVRRVPSFSSEKRQNTASFCSDMAFSFQSAQNATREIWVSGNRFRVHRH